jgi:acetyl-CoA carboxylase alpha subunit
VDRHLGQALKKLESRSPEDLIAERYQKFRKMGIFVEK